MSKAEQRALEVYPYSRAYTDYDVEYDGNFCNRLPYIEGYRQAEKDLELTWEDFVLIRIAFDATEANINLGAIKIQPMTKEYYKEVFKQFKKLKERKEK